MAYLFYARPLPHNLNDIERSAPLGLVDEKDCSVLERIR
jgi:hypothetical protein